MVMADRKWGRLKIFLMLMVGALSACGGGGGGGGSSSVEQTLSLTNVRFSAVDQEVFEGNDQVQSLDVTADIMGNVALLNGRTVFVLVEDPDRLFDPNATLILGANGLNNVLRLVGRRTNTAVGEFRGTIGINVCLDAQCTQRLGGSPVQVPYQVKVLQGLRFSQSGPLALAAQFPIGSSPVVTDVVMPAGTSTFRTELGLDFTNLVDGQLLATLSTTNQTITVTGRSAPVKAYKFPLNVSATAVNSRGRAVQLTASRDIAYTVTGPAALEVRYSPDPLTLSMAYGVASASDEVVVQTIASTGQVFFYPRRIDYVPAGVSGNLDAQGVPWLSVSPSGNTGISTTNFFGGQMALVAVSCGSRTVAPFDYFCLAPGQYEALVYARSSSQEDSPRPLKVSLTVRAR